MGILEKWINPTYLKESYIKDLQEQLKAKPSIKYHVLDNLFIDTQLEKIIDVYDFLPFLTYQRYKEMLASVVKKNLNDSSMNNFYPYESDLINLQKINNHWVLEDTGLPFSPTEEQYNLLTEIAELFLSDDWYYFLSKLVNHTLTETNDQKTMRFKRYPENSKGYWIHTDRFLNGGGINHWGLILYLSKNRKVEDGGLFQIWNMDPVLDPNTPVLEEFDPLQLVGKTRVNIRGAGPGDAFRDTMGDRIYDGETRDMVLVDQIVPAFNRMYLCNFDTNIAYHSITPNTGSDRKAIVQLLGTNIGKQFV